MLKHLQFFFSLVLACCIGHPLSAQHRLFSYNNCPAFLQSSPVTHVYTIPPDSVLRYVYASFTPDPGTNWLKTPAYIIPSGKTDSFLQSQALPAGHYLYITLQQNNVLINKYHKPAFQTHFINLGRTSVLEITGRDNKYDSTVSVKLNGRLLQYDNIMHAYLLSGLTNDDTLVLTKNNDIAYYKPYVYELNTHADRYHEQAYGKTRVYKGYMVTNKPKYLPGDTVKWKAYLLNPFTGQPATETLELKMSDQYVQYFQTQPRYKQTISQRFHKLFEKKHHHGEEYDEEEEYDNSRYGYSRYRNGNNDYGKNYVIDTDLKPVRPGVYFDEFVVADSMDISTQYNLILTSPAGNRLHTQFHVEDYLLNDLRLKVKGDKRLTYQRGDSIMLYIYASTANNLPLMDGQVTVSIIPEQRYDQKGKKLLPDTLYSNTVTVDPSGETVFEIPLGKMPDQNTQLYCYITALSSNNERKDTSISLNYRAAPYYIHTSQSADRVEALMIHNKKSVDATGYYIMNNDTAKHRVRYPASIQVGPHDHTISFFPDPSFDSTHTVASIYLNPNTLTAAEVFIKDTAYLSIQNPQHAFVRYNIYRGQEHLGIGQFSGDTTLKVYSPDGETVTVQAFYFWRQWQSQVFTIYKFDKDINIGVRKKDFVYPGQVDTVSITLEDVNGKPVRNTNLTVLAFNNQFVEDYVPAIPYSGKLNPAAKMDTARELQQLHIPYAQSFKLTDTRWIQLSGADTVFLYRQILDKAKGNTWLKYSTPAAPMPQMAIHVLEKGIYNIPEVIYVDNAPVFYRPVNIASPNNQNGFFIPRGKHTVTVRMQHTQYTITDVNITDKTRLVVFINGDLDLPASIIKTIVGDTLSTGEKQLLSNYYILCKPEYTSNVVYNVDAYGFTIPDADISQRRDYRPYMTNNVITFQQYPVTFSLGQEYNQRRYNYETSNYNYSGIYLAGPFDPTRKITFYQYNNTRQVFNFEPNQLFTFRDGMLRVERQATAQYFSRPASIEYWPDFCYTIPQPANRDTFIVRLKPDSLVPRFELYQSRTARLFADSTSVRGSIQDYNGTGINNAVFILKDRKNRVAIKEFTLYGAVDIRNLQAGTYTVELLIGNKTADIPGVLKVYKDSVTHINIRIASYRATDPRSPYYRSVSKDESKVTPATNGDVVVRYVAPLVNKYDGRVSSALTSEDIKHMPTINTGTMISASSPGLVRGNEDHALNAGGGRSANTVTYVEGVAVHGSTSYLMEVERRRTDVDEGTPGEFLSSAKTQSFISEFMNNQLLAAGLRSNFRDYAIWEPNLWTDKDGKAHFNVTYPDNVTGWKTYVIAMNEKGFSGRSLQMTHAFKPLSAQASIPRFLRYGDTAYGVGKVSNYTKEAFNLQTSFMQNGIEKTSERITVHNIKVAMLPLTAPVTNSIDTGTVTATYTLKAANGYSDGEEKNIPVYFKGTTESTGSFIVMSRDTVIHTRPDSTRNFTGTSYIMIDGSLLEVMLREIENLKVYPYGCTEQLTSKLLAIYYEEEVKHIMGVDKVNNAVARDSIIAQLVKKQNTNGSFGWWNANNADYRITNYVISTMAKMNKDHKLDVVIGQGLRFLANNLAQTGGDYYLRSLQTLSANQYKLDYAKFLSSMNDTLLTLHDSFIVATIKKDQGLPYRQLLDTLIHRGKEHNGLSWGYFNYDWYTNDIATTLLAYRLIENDSIYGHLKDKVMQYLLLGRERGYYRNTAESGQVLTTILPGLVANTDTLTKRKRNTVTIKGTINETVSEFPKRFTSRDKDISLSIAKNGIGPAYVSIVYNYLKEDPEVKDSVFEVNTLFLSDKNDTLTELSAGSKVTLRAIVSCDTTADYIMIEVPIPAGCIQSGGSYPWYGEANRDNYKDKTIVYYDRLYKGTYTIDIPLEVRYKGTFSINPARASMMYYPDKYGNNKIKVVTVK